MTDHDVEHIDPMHPLERVIAAWSAAMVACDTDAVMRLCHPDIRLSLHFGDVPLPFVGTTHGHAAARARTDLMFKTWRFPKSRLKVVAVGDDSAKAMLTMTILHRWTGYSINMTIRQDMRFETNLIHSFDGYMDAPRFNAFMRFAGLAPVKPAKAP